jgi:CarboxypepD_reg-like domain
LGGGSWFNFATKFQIMKNKALLSIIIALITLFGNEAMASKKVPRSSAPATLSSLSGLVIDKNSNEKLTGVMIQLTDTDQKIYTDAKGEFTLNGIEPGTYKVKVNCISYKDKEV